MNRLSCRAIRLAFVLLPALFPVQSFLRAQTPPAPESPPAASRLALRQLENLVAPIADYPDQLLPLVFAAAANPLEVLDAYQWLQQNRRRQGLALITAAQDKKWDISIHVLLVFPDVLGRLATHIHWTSELGSAVLAQRDDVMEAIQRLRARTPGSRGGSSGP
jgi:hypothetical protein